MKRLSLLIFLLVFSQVKVFSQQKGLLFEISGNGLSRPSYIFGTFHLLCEKDFQFSDLMISKISNSSQLALEIDMDDKSMPFKMMKGMKMAGDSLLSDFYTEIEYFQVNSYLKDSLKLPPMMTKNTKPMLLYSMVLTKIMPCKIMTMETELMKIAGKHSIETVGLETIEFQMDVLGKIPNKMQAEYLLETIRNTGKARKEFEDMVEGYKLRNLEFLMEKMLSQEGFDKNMEKAMLTERNINWIPVIEKLISEKPTFIAVGAGHLPGENGVLNLLKSKGYDVKSLE
ncbi:MAG: TraB/GumN family protein [Cytophagaceae bacterium]|nr:TraB/GumN family protein [Cytophagaceae bacterium]MBK9510054.1 TraB/GumN family protein [Cytophagaceae bacterium]MBK9933524.1 TraB/GumN family protein [Cytophagaceae bacterium]MBL0302762.1 TraB/GumN family protein [Cytophagaceae bacterium]MBL0325583.1 TraB/GumN family protein [Cytophagaceae bacterium]